MSSQSLIKQPINNGKYSANIIRYLMSKMIEMPSQYQNEIVQCALHCLESHIKYHSIEALTSSDAANHYLRLKLAREKNEVFAVLFLDNRHRVLAFEKLFFGTISTVSVHPRIVLQRALKHNAAAIILAHNHPSGTLIVSASDEYVTRQIKSALDLVDIRLLDHVIVSVEGVASFVEQGLL